MGKGLTMADILAGGFTSADIKSPPKQSNTIHVPKQGTPVKASSHISSGQIGPQSHHSSGSHPVEHSSPHISSAYHAPHSGFFKDPSSPSGWSFKNKSGDIARVRPGQMHFDNPYVKFLNNYGERQALRDVTHFGRYSTRDFGSPLSFGHTGPSYAVHPATESQVSWVIPQSHEDTIQHILHTLYGHATGNAPVAYGMSSGDIQ